MQRLHNDNLKKFHFDKGFFDAPERYGHLLLFQAGDISCKGGYHIPMHVQLCYELSYITSGKGIYRTNGVDQSVQEGTLCLNLPGQRHEGIADRNDPFRYFYIGFDFADAQDERNDYLDIKAMLDRMKSLSAKDERDIGTLFVGLIHELSHPMEHFAQMVNLYLQQILIVAYRTFYNEKVAAYPGGQQVDNARQLAYQIVNYIDTNLFALSDLSLLANGLGYSYSYLSHLFSKETGLTIQSYFNQRRLEKAAEMLISKQCSVTQIAKELNYNSVHVFSKAFKNYFKVAPSEYQSSVNKG